jgi:hypothetical protein
MHRASMKRKFIKQSISVFISLFVLLLSFAWLDIACLEPTFPLT